MSRMAEASATSEVTPRCRNRDPGGNAIRLNFDFGHDHFHFHVPSP